MWRYTGVYIPCTASTIGPRVPYSLRWAGWLGQGYGLIFRVSIAIAGRCVYMYIQHNTHNTHYNTNKKPNLKQPTMRHKVHYRPFCQKSKDPNSTKTKNLFSSKKIYTYIQICLHKYIFIYSDIMTKFIAYIVIMVIYYLLIAFITNITNMLEWHWGIKLTYVILGLYTMNRVDKTP